MTATELDVRNAHDDPRPSDDRAVWLGSVGEIDVVRETEKAALLLLSDAAGNEREQWFPKAVLCIHSDPNPAMDANLFATRSFIGRNNLWHWTRS